MGAERDQAPVVEHVASQNAEEFLDALSARGRYFREHGPGTWIYRGQRSDTFPLIPSALRPQNRCELLGLVAKAIDDGETAETNWGQELAELELIHDFFDLADAAGLPLPEDSHILRGRLRGLHKRMLCGPIHEYDVREVGYWPQPYLLSLMALAQHHGVPTRLLDWSRNSHKAAHFAASDFLFEKNWIDVSGRIQKFTDERIAVWGISISAVRDVTSIANSVVGELFPLLTITVPRAGNPNLHAQEGVFTLYLKPDTPPLDKVDRRPLDDLLKNDPCVEKTARDWPLLYHFTLPGSETIKLLWLLAKEGITSSTLFPGYDGVARALKERRICLGIPERPVR